MILSTISIILLSITYSQSQALTYKWKNVFTGGGGGFVSGIIFNAGEKDLIYARTDIGGAYRWNQNEGTWKPLLDGFDDWNLYSVDSLAADPLVTSNVYLAVGAHTNNWTSSNGEILISKNKGDTWTKRTKLPFKVGGNMPGRSMGERLAIDPNLNSILFFGARSGNGLWKSNDSGVTFTNVTSFNYAVKYVEKSGDPYLGDIVGVVWVVFDKSTGSANKATKTIYVGVADITYSIYVSNNGGDSWTSVRGEPKGYLPHHAVLSKDGILYVTYSNSAGPYDGTKGEVWKYNTTDSKWQEISPVPANSADNTFGFGGVSVDTNNPKIVMVSSLNSRTDTIIWRSVDSGTTWKRIWEWTDTERTAITKHYNIDFAAAPWLDFGESELKLGSMVGSLAIDPQNSDKMLYGTGLTIFASHDLTNWDNNKQIHITVEAKGIEETSVLKVITVNNRLYSAMRNVSGFRHDTTRQLDILQDDLKVWSVPFVGTFTDIDYAEIKQKFMVLVGYGKPTANPPIVSSAYSTDYGDTWTAANTDPSGMTEGGGTVAVSRDGTVTVWSPTSGGVFYADSSHDALNSWTKCSGIDGKAIVGSDRVNSAKFYAFANHTFWVSTVGTDGAVKFTATKFKSSADSYQFKTASNGDIWFAAGTSGLWHSTDSGDTFKKVSKVDVANVVGISQSYLYIHGSVGSDTGIFRSIDGVDWPLISDATHQYGRVQCIAGDNNRVFVGTNGRGIFYGEP